MLSKSVAERPNDPEALTLLAKVTYLLGDKVKSSELLEGVLLTNPTYIDALAAYGYSKASLGETDKALAYLKRAFSLRQDPIIARAIATLEMQSTH